MSNRARGHGHYRSADAAIVAALIVTLSACTPEPRDSDVDTRRPPTSAPSPSLSLTAPPTPVPPGTIAALSDGVAPGRPVELTGPASLDAAKVIAPYFLQLIPYARNTNDVAELKALSHPECVFCQSVISGVAELGSIDGHSTGGGVTISDVTGVAVDPRNWFSIDLTMQEAPSQDVDERGTVLKDYDAASTYDVEIIVVLQDGVWLVRGVSYEPREG